VLLAGLPPVVLGLGLPPCSKTRQRVEADGDVVLSSGPTLLGWTGIWALTVFAAVFFTFFILLSVVGIGSGSIDALRERKILPALGWALMMLVFAGAGAFGAWQTALQTALKHHETTVTASPSEHALTAERRRPFGADEVRRWGYEDITRLDYKYVPGTSGETSSPPQGIVHVVGSDQTRTKIYDGSACTARDLADGINSVVGVPLRVDTGWRDLSGFPGFLTQLRCGTAQPFRPTSLTEYPAEAWRVLDLPFLWHWPWSLPVVVGQLGLLVGAAFVDGRWRARRRGVLVRAVGWILAAAGVAALNVLAANSYGSWPAALALLALLSMQFAGKRLRPEPEA
jgi:hypothetical protein